MPCDEYCILLLLPLLRRLSTISIRQYVPVRPAPSLKQHTPTTSSPLMLIIDHFGEPDRAFSLVCLSVSMYLMTSNLDIWCAGPSSLCLGAI